MLSNKKLVAASLLAISPSLKAAGDLSGSETQIEPVAVVCSYTVNTTPIALEDWGTNSTDGSSTGNLEIETNSPYCEWTAQSDSNWLTISPSEGVGNATIQYVAQLNNSLEIRSAKLTIAGETIDVTQKRLGAWVLFDENFDSIPPKTYTKTYKKGQTIDAINLYVFHLYSMMDMTDFWLAISLPPSLGSGWMYKKTPNATIDFVPFSLTQLETMKPLVTNITDADIFKDGFGEYTWSVIPLLQNGAGLPTGEYTFYAIATIKEQDKTSSTVKWISYNPITYFGDLTKIFSNLAIFKLIITD